MSETEECAEEQDRNNQERDSFLEEGAATTTRDRGSGQKKRRVVRVGQWIVRIPLFLDLLIFYIIVKMLVVDVRVVLFTLGDYQLTWVEIFYIIGSNFGMAELLKTSKPGISNLGSAMGMLAAASMYVILMTIGITTRNTIFSNTEFLVLMLMSINQAILAFIINARTLVRTFDRGGGID